MKKICVDKDRCICCGACFVTDPEHFTLGSDNKSEVISNENLESNNLQNAIEFCPTVAISIIETEENEEVENSCECDDECVCGNECHCEGCHHEEE